MTNRNSKTIVKSIKDRFQEKSTVLQIVTAEAYKIGVVPILVLFLSMECFAGDRLNKEAQENADRFFEAIINGDYEAAYKYTSGSLAYQVTGKRGNVEIGSKKEFIDKSGWLLNKPFRDVLKMARSFTVECCLSSHYVWSEKKVTIWFTGDGQPFVISNPYKIVIEPSFDCSKAKFDVEKAICSSLSLARQDNELKSTYDEAKILLTGQEYKELKSEQILFINKRRQCGSNKDCIEKTTERRIVSLNELIEHEKEKAEPVTDDGLGDTQGLWKSVGYKSSAYCGKSSDEEIAANEKVEIYINTPSILITTRKQEGKKIQKYCRLNKVHSDTFAKVYYRTVYGNNYWGSCGGNIFNLPYAGRYIYLELSSMSESESDCGFIVLTGHEEESPSLVYGEYLVDDILLSSGHVLETVK